MTNGKIIEVIGLAGAGKSTLISALTEKKSDYAFENFPSVRKIADFPFFVKNLLGSYPRIIRLQKTVNRKFSQRELAWLAVLNGWPQRLSKLDGRIVLLDQGPVFLIASLIGLDPQAHISKGLQSAWFGLLEKWAHTLDLLTWLDADDLILYERIKTREKDHFVKGKTECEVREFLTHNRKIFGLLTEQIIAINPKIKILKINSGQNSLSDVADMVIAAIDQIAVENQS